MQGILTTSELIEALRELPPDAPVMVAVVKYPEEFKVRFTPGGTANWADHTDVECIPLEEITITEGMVTLTVELADYDEQRHFAGG